MFKIIFQVDNKAWYAPFFSKQNFKLVKLRNHGPWTYYSQLFNQSEQKNNSNNNKGIYVMHDIFYNNQSVGDE